jgi:hypothetical protein
MNRIIATVSRKLATSGPDGRSNFGSNGASFTVELDITPEMIDNPQYLLERGRSAYSLAEAMVAEQLVRSTQRPKIAPMTQAEVDQVTPVQARVNQPPPATPPPSTPAPVVAPPANGRPTFYGGKGRGQDGPPTTGAQLGGFAKRTGCLPWFEAFAAEHKLPKLCSQWSDDWAKYAHGQYLAACIPAVPSTNGAGPPPY